MTWGDLLGGLLGGLVAVAAGGGGLTALGFYARRRYGKKPG